MVEERSFGGRDLNKIFLSGRLTKDPEVKTAQSGKAYTRVGIAVDRAFSKDKEVDFFNLVVFGKTAEFLGKWFSKGSKLLVEGRLQNSTYKDKEGNDRTATEVIVDNVEFADSKKPSGGGKTNESRSDDDDFPPGFDPPF